MVVVSMYLYASRVCGVLGAIPWISCYVALELTASLQIRRFAYHCLGFLTTEMHNLQKMLDEDEDISAVRAADGRGPLFWAHEAKNDDAIELLKVNNCVFHPSEVGRVDHVVENLHAYMQKMQIETTR